MVLLNHCACKEVRERINLEHALHNHVDDVRAMIKASLGGAALVKQTRKTVIIVLFTVLMVSMPLAWTRDDVDRRTVSPEAIAVDTLVARPAGIVATFAGTVVFIVALPFSLLTGDTSDVAEKLVATPARYTFIRPMGVGIFDEIEPGCQPQSTLDCPQEYAY